MKNKIIAVVFGFISISSLIKAFNSIYLECKIIALVLFIIALLVALSFTYHEYKDMFPDDDNDDNMSYN